MNDDGLQQLLRRADERFQIHRAASVSDRSGATGFGSAEFVESIRRRRAHQIRRRASLVVLAFVTLITGVTALSTQVRLWGGRERSREAVATNVAEADSGKSQATTNAQPAQGRRLRDDEVAQLKAEIAALDAEANRARRFVELYQTAEARRERLAATEAAVAEPLLPPQALADLEIDRAAGITVISADAQAKQFNRMDDAADAYRSVLKHFPDSRWASVARERLARVTGMN